MSGTSETFAGRFTVPPGVRYMLASAFFFSLMSLMVKAAGRGLPSQEIVLARGVVSLVLSYWLVRRARVSPWGNRKWILILRGLFGFAALSCFYFALTRLPIAEATVLHYTNPLWTAVFAALLLHERITPKVLVPILVSFLGVVLVVRPGFLFGNAASQIDPVGVGVALAGAMVSALAYVAVREASKTEHPLVIVFYFPLVTVPATLPFISGFTWPQGGQWLLLIGVGVSTQIAQVYLTKGLSLERAGRAMAVGYSQILLVALWGMLFFGEFLNLWSWIGSLFVVLGTLAVGLRRRTPVPGAAHTEVTGRETA
jgi:drug/metabolite transporter (DMT)-like permease